MNFYQKRYNTFRTNLGKALVFKMEADGVKIRDLAETLSMSTSSLSQIRQGLVGVRGIPSLDFHFRVMEWLDSPLINFERPEGRDHSTVSEVHDMIMRLDIGDHQKETVCEIVKLVMSRMGQS